MYSVYCHINKINNKMYIGMTKQNPSNRWGKNGNKYKSSKYFYSAIQKYGWDNFEHIILFENLTEFEACNKEIELILKYNTTNREFGYNSTFGGEHFTMTEEAKLKLSKAMIGNKNSQGHPCTKEKANKISNALKGKKFNDEHKQKLSAAAKQRHVACSETKKEILRNTNPKMKKVYCSETNKIYKSIQECARELNLFATNVSKVCKGKMKSTKGYHLSYYDDTKNA